MNIGDIPEEVLDHEDSFPLSTVDVALAVEEMTGADRDQACRALARVMAHRAAALPFLRMAYETAIGKARLRYAKLLGFWGEEGVADDLLQALEGRKWDDKIYQGRMAEYAHNFTPVDTLLLARALYRCGDHEGIGERILNEYTSDVRGLFVRHAEAVLEERAVEAPRSVPGGSG